MTLIMAQCKRCGEPVGVDTSGAHRGKRSGNHGGTCVRRVRCVHTDTERTWCGFPRWLVGLRARPDIDRLARDTVAVLDDTYTLLFLEHRDDGLTPRQIQVLLDGHNEYESDEFSMLEEHEADMLADETDAVLRRDLLDEELYELLDDAGHLDEIRWEVRDRDDSGGLVDLLLTASSSHLFRYDLDVDVPDWAIVEERFEEVAKEIADAAGLDLAHPPTAALMAGLLANAQDGGSLSLLWYTDPVDAVALSAPHDPREACGTVVFRGAHLLILNSWTGSGHDAPVPMITARWEPRRVAIDAKGMPGGYSWTDTAGPVASAYAGDYELTRRTVTEAVPGAETSVGAT